MQIIQVQVKQVSIGIHIIGDMTNRAALELNNLVSTHQDRARVNTGAIGNIFKTFPEANPVRNYFCTHPIRKYDKKAIGG